MKKRLVGLAGSAIWLVAVSSLFFALSFTALGRPYAWWGLSVAVAATMTSTAASILLIRAAGRLPVAPRTPDDLRTLWQFVAVFGGEIAAFIVAYTFLPSAYIEFLPAINIAIVGLHFLPLARIFQVDRYYALGLFFSAVGLATAVVVIVHGQGRGVPLGYILPGLVLAPGTWAIALGNLREAHKTLARIG